MAASEPSKRKQIETKRDVVLRELALDSAKLRAAVDAALAVRDALQASPKGEPDEELDHLAILLGCTRIEKGTRLALKAVVAKYMGLHETDKKAWEAYRATEGAFKDWTKDFKRFMQTVSDADDHFSGEELLEMLAPKCKHNDCDRARRVEDAAGDYTCCGFTCARLHYGLRPRLPTCKLFRCRFSVYVEGERVHDFCCWSHALEAISFGEHPPSQPAGLPAPKEKQCALPGCTDYRHRSLDVEHEYCSRVHALDARKRLLSDRKRKRRRVLKNRAAGSWLTS